MAVNFGELNNPPTNKLNKLRTVTKQPRPVRKEFNTLLESKQSNFSTSSRFLNDPLSNVSNDLIVALDENLNKFQKSIDDTISQIDPELGYNLPNIISTSKAVATGINQIVNQIDGNISNFVSNLDSVSNQITDNYSEQFQKLSSVLRNVTGSVTGVTAADPNYTKQISDVLPKLPNDFGQKSQRFDNVNNSLKSNSSSNNIESANAYTNPGQYMQNTINNLNDLTLDRTSRVGGGIRNVSF